MTQRKAPAADVLIAFSRLNQIDACRIGPATNIEGARWQRDTAIKEVPMVIITFSQCRLHELYNSLTRLRSNISTWHKRSLILLLRYNLRPLDS
jgi:hypothetical protein